MRHHTLMKTDVVVQLIVMSVSCGVVAGHLVSALTDVFTRRQAGLLVAYPTAGTPTRCLRRAGRTWRRRQDSTRPPCGRGGLRPLAEISMWELPISSEGTRHVEATRAKLWSLARRVQRRAESGSGQP